MKHYIFIRRLKENESWGGCENRLLEYFKNADYSRCAITVVTDNDIYSDKIEEFNLPVKIFRTKYCRNSGFLKEFGNIYATLSSLKPDRVVFVQGAFTDFRFGSILAGFIVTKGNIYDLEVLGAPEPDKRPKANFSGHNVGVGLWWYKRMFLYMIRGWFCKKILTVSNEVKQRLVTWYHYPSKRVHAIFHGVNTEKFNAAYEIKLGMRKEYGIPETAKVVISTARLSEEKCLDRLIQAFDKCSLKHDDAWLVILGEGRMKEELEALAKSKRCHDRIKFLGHQKEVDRFLKMSDIFLLPSDIEGLGIALLEAMSSALICVATITPGPAEIVQNGINGFLTDRDSEGVYQGLDKALSLDNEQGQEMSRAARDYILQNFELKVKVKNAMELLDIGSTFA